MEIPFFMALGLLLVSGFVFYLLIRRNRKMSEKNKKTLNKTVSDLTEAHAKEVEELNTKIREMTSAHERELIACEERYNRKLYADQCNIETRKEVLSQKSDKELLTDVILDLETYGRRFEHLENRVFNIGDSIMDSISTSHNETVAKLGVHGDMSVASILADLLELISKQ